MTSEILRTGEWPTDTEVEKSMLKEKCNAMALQSKEPMDCSSLFSARFATLLPLAPLACSQHPRLAVSLDDPAQLTLKSFAALTRTALRAAA